MLQLWPDDMAKLTGDAVALHRVTHFFGHDEADLRFKKVGSVIRPVERYSYSLGVPARSTECVSEISRSAHSMVGRQQGSG